MKNFPQEVFWSFYRFFSAWLVTDLGFCIWRAKECQYMVYASSCLLDCLLLIKSTWNQIGFEILGEYLPFSFLVCLLSLCGDLEYLVFTFASRLRADLICHGFCRSNLCARFIQNSSLFLKMSNLWFLWSFFKSACLVYDLRASPVVLSMWPSKNISHGQV